MELRSVRAASEHLHVTQPAISRQIRDLEEAIGATLFERTTRGMKLTSAGIAYLSEARDILARVDAANRLAHRIAPGEQGRLRVGFVENASWSGLVSSTLSAFQHSASDVALELQPMNTPEQLDAIAAERLDVAFVIASAHCPKASGSSKFDVGTSTPIQFASDPHQRCRSAKRERACQCSYTHR
ncbi:LysR family transcriptional regulator [Caballeronia catudaia]|uniref:LysR family transcriptional regulator n=1 Tax=Caballeronia catudaia TaxID=1777136 RepID=A0A158CJZ2_9BURK|nr:LysR family transcriptional regulator [Caballeronia catudaia]